MGKTKEEPIIDERVKAARARLERLRKEQGVPGGRQTAMARDAVVDRFGF